MGRVTLIGLLSAAAAGVVVGGLFAGIMARAVAVAAAAIGAGAVGLSARRGRTWLQYLAVPLIFVSGYLAALILPNATGVRGTVPQLVRQALTNGGLAHPPLPFDPGWRFLLVALIGLLAAAGVSLGCSYRRPRLAVLVATPVVLAGALNQPKGAELAGSGAALALILAALSLSYTLDLAGDGDLGRRFEARQLVRSGAAIVACLLVLAALSRASVLFPEPAHSHDAKPQKPKVVPLSKVPDRPLFVVDSASSGPWRLGVLDSYAQDTWLLPPYDPTRLDDVGRAGAVTEAGGAPSTGHLTSTFTVEDLHGYTLPGPAAPQRVAESATALQFDPRTQTFRTKNGAAAKGLRYRVVSAAAPTAKQLDQAAARPLPAAVRGYLAAPEAPSAVIALLASAPHNPWQRLQVLRSALYEKVVAAGSGLPTPVPPAKVVAMLDGGRASPFEIVAGEALLARWAGLPSRIGYGFYGGTKIAAGMQFRPRDGANWLEVYLPGLSWVPVLGTPRQAESSLSAHQRNSDPRILPSSQVSLPVYVPVLNRDPQLLFEQVRFWLVRGLPLAALAFLLWRLVAVPARQLRRWRRRRWARRHGFSGRIAVAYADFRDRARDLGVDSGRATPLEFLDEVEPDQEHRELAWLTTRALWGDLRRDLREADAAAAEALARSVGTRLARGQGGLVQVTALTSRQSLRRPWDPALPNAWPQPRRVARRRGRIRARWRRLRRTVRTVAVPS